VEIVTSHAEMFSRADMVVKVKEPLPEEYPLLRKDQILFTYLHLAASRSLTEALQKTGVTCIAYETVRVNNRLPLLEPMSEIAGRMSAPVGGYSLRETHRWQGRAPRWRARRLARENRCHRRWHGRSERRPHGHWRRGRCDDPRGRSGADAISRYHDEHRDTLYSSEASLLDLLPSVDLLIGAVLVPGAKAPKLITREMLRLMKPNSVVVDIAIDQGGCLETSRPTTHDNPTFVEEGIVHYCVANMPGAYARTATQALTNVTYRYIETLADFSLVEAFQRAPGLREGLSIFQGGVTCKVVAEAHGLDYTPNPAI
jgi:alanine dehydrogenase